MKNSKLAHFIKNINNSHSLNTIIIFTMFAIILTFILASKYIIFQKLINKDGLSKREIVANKTIEVVDTFKTEQLRKEVAQKVDYVLTPAEDDFIKNNLEMLQNSIMQIRKKDVDENVNNSIKIELYV